jgi:hypothetical protein
LERWERRGIRREKRRGNSRSRGEGAHQVSTPPRLFHSPRGAYRNPPCPRRHVNDGDNDDDVVVVVALTRPRPRPHPHLHPYRLSPSPHTPGRFPNTRKTPPSSSGPIRAENDDVNVVVRLPIQRGTVPCLLLPPNPTPGATHLTGHTPNTTTWVHPHWGTQHHPAPPSPHPPSPFPPRPVPLTNIKVNGHVILIT